jgi:hypothetical protein
MATLVKTPSGTWKALIRKNGWPTVAKTFRTKRDAEDWSRRTEEEMVRGVYIRRSGSEKMTLEAALNRYLSDITPTKKPTTQRGETSKAKKLIEHLGKYSLAATPTSTSITRNTSGLLHVVSAPRGIPIIIRRLQARERGAAGFRDCSLIARP